MLVGNAGGASAVTLISGIYCVIMLVFMAAVLYTLFLVIKALRIYIRKNS